MSTRHLFTEPLLGVDFPLPLDRPFTSAQAREAGLSPKVVQRLVREGYLRRLVKGVFVAAQVPDSMFVRTQALRLVAPEDSVITDWTAVWLYTRLLPPGGHLDVPPVSLFRRPGNTRLRNGLCESGERAFLKEDLVVIDGLTVTTPLRTAWDICRFTHRDKAIGALDALLRLGDFSTPELLEGVERFRKQRGVVQLRELAPLGDARSESTGESLLRLRWRDISQLPQPEPQVAIEDASGRTVFWLDLGIRNIRFAAEYDGEEFHTNDDDRDFDARRRKWIEVNRGWLIEPVRKHNLSGPTRDIESVLIRGVAEARRQLSRPRPRLGGRREEPPPRR